MTTTSRHADTTNTPDIVMTTSSNKPEEVLKYNVKFNGILELTRNKNRAKKPIGTKIKTLIPNYFAGTKLSKSSESSESSKLSKSSKSSESSMSSESSQSSSSKFYVFPGTKSSKSLSSESRQVDSNWKKLVNKHEKKVDASSMIRKTTPKTLKKKKRHWKNLVDKYSM